MTEQLAQLVSSGRIIDIALALVALEALLGLIGLRRIRGGMPLGGWLAHLAAGACLMIALRASLTGAGWEWVAIALLGALLAHVVDLAARLSR